MIHVTAWDTKKDVQMIENERCLLCSGCAIVHIKRNGNRIFIYTQSQLDETIEVSFLRQDNNILYQISYVNLKFYFIELKKHTAK